MSCILAIFSIRANGTSVCETLENGQNCTPFLGMDATRPWDSADLKGFVSPMADFQLKGSLHLNFNWCILEFPRDWSKSPFPKNGLQKYYCRRSESRSDLIRDIYGSVMYSPAAVKIRMTSLCGSKRAWCSCHMSYTDLSCPVRRS